MTLSIEKFNTLATKTDLENLKEEMNEKMDKILTIVDGIAKKYDDHDSEHVANIDAHDRMQEEIDGCRKKLNLRVSTSVS